MNKNYEKSDSDVADADANRYKLFFINFLNLHIISMNMEKIKIAMFFSCKIFIKFYFFRS